MATTNSLYLKNKIVDHALGTSAFTMPAAVSLALFTVNPNFQSGVGGTEATGGSYARLALLFIASVAGSASNSAIREFIMGTNLAAGTYTGWAAYDAASAGNLLFGDTFSASRVISITGDKISFAIGSIVYSTT